MCGLYPGTTCPSTSRVFYLSFHFAPISLYSGRASRVHVAWLVPLIFLETLVATVVKRTSGWGSQKELAGHIVVYI
jgi:hypothetical protein